MRSALLLPFLCSSLLALCVQAEPASIFNGKTLDGWDYDPKIWRIENGMITGGSATEKIRENHFICTKQSYQNFELKLKIKCSGDPATGMINSGIQIRSVRVPGGAHMSGYQIDCGKGWFGKIYDEFRRNRVIAEPLDAVALEKAVDVYGWNEYRIRADGPRIQVWINGVAAIDYTEQDKNIALDGQIGPQVHSGGVCLVQVQDVSIEELPPTPGAPTWQSLGGVDAARKLVAPPPKPRQADSGARSTSKPARDLSYNTIQGEPKTAAEQQKLFHLPPGYEIELVVQESAGIGKFVSVYFDQRGRMWTQTALEYPVDANENPAAAESLYQSKGRDKVLVYPRAALNAPTPPGGLTSPTVFADGLAIPLGILPWGNGDTCYIQHGHDLKLLKDTNGDGRADTHEVILTGFGIQDSHLFPHQFTRAPGGWIWMAQGLFNNSKVHRPGSDKAVDWPMCSMARMRPDGSEFEVTSVGPNNIWGLAITAEGDAFIQEANDYGYPVIPFHEFAYYPSGAERLKKSYQPDFPPMTDFRMGGTGLSGLALIESGLLAPQLASKNKPAAKQPGYLMAIANPIISKIQTIAMHRDGAYWKLEQAADLVTCDDPFFRPVALTNGPDGCIFIVDWYNKIISHNEVPRAHPDRDKTRGRIWRVKPKGQTASGALDMAALPTDAMLDYLESPNRWAQDMAAQILADRNATKHLDTLKTLVNDENKDAATRIHALWAWEELGCGDTKPLARMLTDKHPAIRREAARALGSFERDLGVDLVAYFLKPVVNDADPSVRRAAIQTLGRLKKPSSASTDLLISFAKPSLPGPLGQSSRGPNQIPVREAYDREFERFLVRMFLERHPNVVAKFLDSDAAAKLPIEARVLASLALEPKTSASRVATLLPQLNRAPNDEELLRLAQFPEEPGVGDALKALLTNEKSRATVAGKLLAQRTNLDASKIAPLLVETARALLGSADTPVRKNVFATENNDRATLALQLIGGFQLTALEAELVACIKSKDGFDKKNVLQALRDLRSSESELFASVAKSDPDPLVRDAATEALAVSRAPDAASRLLALYPELAPAQRRAALHAASSTKAGAKTIVAAVLDKKLPQTDLDSPTVERIATMLDDDPALEKLQQQLGGIFCDVLLLDGQDSAWVDSRITLDGPFTVECWVRLAEGITNNDGILGSPGQVDMNFHQSKFRVWVGDRGLHDVVVAQKPITPDLWTHVAVTRDATGVFKLYQNGEIDAVGTKTTTAQFEKCRIGWTQPAKGTEGAICEFRVWHRERTAAEIRASFDRRVGNSPALVFRFASSGRDAHTTMKGARIARTIDAPPLLTEAQAQALDAKFAQLAALAPKGNSQNGKVLSALCLACHQIGNAGAQIGPNLSGAGAMGLEAVLRNILTPNAAMEPGYRIFRVEMKNGDLVDAFLVSEDRDAFVIRQPGLPDRRIHRSETRSAKFIRRSLMPENLLDALPDQQVADLLAYLMALKG